MKKLIQAPNLAIATLWADVLNDAGCGVTVQRAFASGIAGEAAGFSRRRSARSCPRSGSPGR